MALRPIKAYQSTSDTCQKTEVKCHSANLREMHGPHISRCWLCKPGLMLQSEATQMSPDSGLAPISYT